MEATLARCDVPLGTLPPSPAKEKSQWSTEEYQVDRIRGPSVDTLLAPSDNPSDLNDANYFDEPRVQEPYEVALKVRLNC